MKKNGKICLILVLVAIVAAVLLKTVWWPVDKVLPDVENITEALVVEVSDGSPHSRSAYADEETVGELATVLGDMTLRFDRKSDTFAYASDVPSYDLMLSGEGFSYGVIFVSGTRLHHDNTTFIMTEEDAAALNDVLASCFS